MDPSACFSADHAEARAKFREAAGAAGARLTSYPSPERGPLGEDLAADTAWLGPERASRVLMTISATHGVEGFAGSGIQVAGFADGVAKALPEDTALLAVHAVNPYGFAWLRRVTEENVDLNRNFVDHAQPLPENPEYDLLAEAICPSSWDEASRAASGARLAEFGLKHGAAALQKAVSGGQYRHPGGIFYGGAAPSWARRTLERILAEELGLVRRLAVIDYHTGLGPYGHGEAIVMDRPGSPNFERARRWYGETVTSPAAGSSASPMLSGDALGGIARALPEAELTGMGLEFGTKPLGEVLETIRADNWLHLHGDPRSSEGGAIKRAIRDAFYCDAEDWKAMLVEQGLERQRQALRGLAAP
jgi:Protein of unknown function (DUF2817)